MQRIADRSFNIRLRSTSEDKDTNVLTMNVVFPSTYPKTLPGLKLLFDEGIPSSTKRKAQNAIESKPKALGPGTEIIHEVAIFLQDLLDEASLDNSRDVPTLDEERVMREATLIRSQEEERIRQLQATEAEDGKVLEKEQRLLQELVEQEMSRSEQRKSMKASSLTAQPHTSSNTDGLIQFDQSTMIKDPSGTMLNFRLLCDKVSYRQGPAATTFTVQVRQSNEDLESSVPIKPIQAPFLLLKECSIPSSGLDDTVKKEIQNLETKLDQQTNHQTSHSSVLKPINYLITRSDSSKENIPSSGWTVHVLTELASGGSLSDLLEMVGQLSDVKKIRAWALQLLEGLHHYHRHGFGHGGIHLNNILFEFGEARNVIVRLSDGIYGRVLHLLTGSPNFELPLSWMSPEDTSAEVEVFPASDVWYFGVCLLQMGFGKDVVQKYSSPATLLHELKLSMSFKALLRQVFDRSPRKRPSAWDALHYEFFRNDDALLDNSGFNPDIEGSSVPNSTKLLSQQPRRESLAVSASSRYVKEFAEDGKLGRGGYGEVFRARNRIDGQLYAIKKIKARSRAALDPVLSEASVLSRLNHPNVVRYYASWIDEATKYEDKDESKTTSSIDEHDELSSSLSHFGIGPTLPPSSRVIDANLNLSI